MSTPKFKVGQRVWTTWTAMDSGLSRRERPFNRSGKKALVTLLGRKASDSSASGTVYRVRVPECCNNCGTQVLREHWLDTAWFQACKTRKAKP